MKKSVMSCSILALAVLAGTASALDMSSGAARVSIVAGQSGNVLRLSDGRTVATTSNAVTNPQVTQALGLTIVRWHETVNGQAQPFYALAREGWNNEEFSRALPNPTVVDTQFQAFDPMFMTPEVPARLQAKQPSGDSGVGAYIVQFIVPPTQEMFDAVAAAGAEIRQTMHDNGRIVTMTPGTAAQLAQMPFVRWVGDFHPAYKMEVPLYTAFMNAGDSEPNLPYQYYSVMVVGETMAEQGEIAAILQTMGGDVRQYSPETARLEAWMTPAQLESVVNSPYVLFIDRRGEMEIDMDIMRQFSGANAIETAAGYNGSGVRGEVADTQLNSTNT